MPLPSELGLATHYIASSRVPILLENLAALEQINSEERQVDVSEDDATLLDYVPERDSEDKFTPTSTKGQETTTVAEEDEDAVIVEEDETSTLALDMIDSAIEELSLEREEHDPPAVIAGPIRAALDRAFRHDTVEEIVADLRKYSKHSNVKVATWAQETLADIEMRSPTSLKVALMAIRYGRDLETLRECLQMELNIAHAFCVRPSIVPHTFVH